MIKDKKKLFDEYIFVCPDNEYSQIMWSDLKKASTITFFDSPTKINNKILKWINHAHFSFYINSYINLPFKGIWNSLYSISSISFVEKRKYIIIFTDNSIARIDYNYLHNLKQKYDITIALLNLNTINKKEKLILKYFNLCDLIYSFDKGDANNYNLVYYPYNYSKFLISKDYEQPNYDVIFIGNAKNRLSVIHKLFDVIESNEYESVFYISNVKEKEKKKKTTIHYNKWISYRRVLDYVQQSFCILEIVDENQIGYTLRTFEAICYNKHLLTNNKSIINSKYYNPKYIHIFDSDSEIDLSFLKQETRADFNYNDDFSPLRFIDQISKDYEEMQYGDT